jgi:hypothetical protein
VLPGEYTVKLTADGQSYSQRFQVTLDPRIKTPPAGLEKQFNLTTRVTEMMNAPQGREGRMAARLAGLLNVLQDSDAPPTTQAEQAVEELEKAMKSPAVKAALDNEPDSEGDEP